MRINEINCNDDGYDDNHRANTSDESENNDDKMNKENCNDDGNDNNYNERTDIDSEDKDNDKK